MIDKELFSFIIKENVIDLKYCENNTIQSFNDLAIDYIEYTTKMTTPKTIQELSNLLDKIETIETKKVSIFDIAFQVKYVLENMLLENGMYFVSIDLNNLISNKESWFNDCNKIYKRIKDHIKSTKTSYYWNIIKFVKDSNISRIFILTQTMVTEDKLKEILAEIEDSNYSNFRDPFLELSELQFENIVYDTVEFIVGTEIYSKQFFLENYSATINSGDFKEYIIEENFFEKEEAANYNIYWNIIELKKEDKLYGIHILTNKRIYEEKLKDIFELVKSNQFKIKFMSIKPVGSTAASVEFNIPFEMPEYSDIRYIIGKISFTKNKLQTYYPKSLKTFNFKEVE